MFRLTIIFLLSFFVLSCNNEALGEFSEEQTCDNGTFVGNVTLSSQQEVENFASNCYSKIEGSLHIGKPGYGNNDITDLSSLESLTEVYPGRIFIRCYELTNLDGLNNIAKAGGLTLSSCYNLENIQGLSGLLTIGNLDSTVFIQNKIEQLRITDCISLNNLDGLQNLTRVKSIYIAGNRDLSSLYGLENISELGIPEGSEAYDFYGHLTIGWFPCADACNVNLNLTNVCALQNFFSTGQYDINKISIKLVGVPPSYDVIVGVQDVIDGNCSL